MGQSNSNLSDAKKNKNDEFYTFLSDIEDELKYYRKHFAGKTVLCNCDDPYESNFFKFFVLNFNRLKLKKLICTCYAESHVAFEQLSMLDMPYAVEAKRTTPYKAIVTSVHDTTGDGGIDMADVKNLFFSGENKLTKLKGNGSYNSDECIRLMKEADIVVTNPPFSQFIPYLTLLIDMKKDFLIIGSMNDMTDRDIFPLFMQNKVWLGYTSPKRFYVPDSNTTSKNISIDDKGRRIATFGNVLWYTNLDIKKRHEELLLYKKYTAENYPHYDNYDAIEVSKISDIPCDYEGMMGVPQSFLMRYDPDQFEILGTVSAPKVPGSLNLGKNYKDYIGYKQDGSPNGRNGSTFGKVPVIVKDDGIHPYYENADGIRVQAIYPRIFIRNKHPQSSNGGDK